MPGFPKGQGPLGRSFPYFWRDRNGAPGGRPRKVRCGSGFYDGWMEEVRGSAMISCCDELRPGSVRIEVLEEDADENVKSIRRRIL